MEDEEPGVVERLTNELRQYTSIIREVNVELSSFGLTRMSLKGAVCFLLREKRLLDEVRTAVSRARRRAEDSTAALIEIEKILRRDD